METLKTLEQVVLSRKEQKEEGSYTIWQYSEHGKVNGIPKAVDLCRFRKGYGVKDIKL